MWSPTAKSLSVGCSERASRAGRFGVGKRCYSDARSAENYLIRGVAWSPQVAFTLPVTRGSSAPL